MAQSFRLLFYNVPSGRHRFNYNLGLITERSAVVITAAEWSVNAGAVSPTSIAFNPNGGRTHLGNANVWVTNIGVHGPEGGPDGGVEFHYHVSNADFPINVAVTITVLDEIPDGSWDRIL